MMKANGEIYPSKLLSPTQIADLRRQWHVQWKGSHRKEKKMELWEWILVGLMVLFVIAMPIARYMDMLENRRADLRFLARVKRHLPPRRQP